MSNLNKLDFIALEVSKRNYLKHIHNTLQTEYLAEEDPRALWVALANRFDYQNDMFLPEVRHDWQHLCFQDFKSVKKHNQLLMKNHQARPTGVTIVLETHYSTNQCPKRQKRHGRGGQKPFHLGQLSQGLSNGGNKAHKRLNLAPKALNFKNKGKAPETMDADMCYHCGSKDHWSHVC
ncbi:hypothetical protein ACFX2J_024801 [Malus domestica]